MRKGTPLFSFFRYICAHIGGVEYECKVGTGVTTKCVLSLLGYVISVVLMVCIGVAP